jgi:hypothetical protein
MLADHYRTRLAKCRASTFSVEKVRHTQHQVPSIGGSESNQLD